MVRGCEVTIRKTIRRQQLREIVPLADSTIYEMEQRGEFPRRFALSPPLRRLGPAGSPDLAGIAPVSPRCPCAAS
jgi:predicted DNA-binding transcriptional regulator AlpA